MEQRIGKFTIKRSKTAWGGEEITLTGRPGSGKTTYANEIAKRLEKQGKKVMRCFCENSEEGIQHSITKAQMEKPNLIIHERI